jgi:dTDP-4-dehydrorhamnose 3,5-epimerase
MATKIVPALIEDVKLVFSDVYEDNRGFFRENYVLKDWIDNKFNINFVQDNYSFSKKGVIRGLHYQVEPFSQGKLVSCLKGAIIDVAVDLRFNSDTFLKWVMVELNEKDRTSIYIPPEFAHGFLAMDDSLVYYKATNFYDKESERTIRWDDPKIKIDWPVINPILSDKDRFASNWEKVDLF